MRATRFQRSMQLEEKDLLEEEKMCPFCGSMKRRAVAILQERPTVELMECDRCHAVSASRMPTAEVLLKYYNSYYKDNSDKVTIVHPERLSAHIHRHIPRSFEKDSIAILDFGGGSGAISARLAEKIVQGNCKKAHIDLVDFNTELVTPEDDRVTITHVQNLDIIKGRKYEIVIASAILEHITYPEKTIAALIEAVDVNGFLYVRTPYIVPMMKLCRKVGISIDFTYPGHVHDLGQEFWDWIADSTWSGSRLDVVRSAPSIPELSIGEDPLRGLAASVLKAPWRVLGNRYKLVGGWEIIARKK